MLYNNDTPVSSNSQADSVLLPLDTLAVIYNLIPADDLEYLEETTLENIFDYLKDLSLSIIRNNHIAFVRLNWQYPDNNAFMDFQLYRSAPGNAMMLYRTLTPADLDGQWTWIDEDIDLNSRYRYKLMARHRDGGFSEWSPVIMARVE